MNCRYKRFLLVCEDFVQLQYRALRKQRQKRKGRKDARNKRKPQKFHLPPHLLQLSKAAIQAICRVFVARPYFNYREQVSTLVVNNLVNRDKEISDICYNCLKQIYKEDQYGMLFMDGMAPRRAPRSRGAGAGKFEIRGMPPPQ